jgi:DNA primase
MMDALNFYRAELKKSRTAIDYLKGAACRARSPRATASGMRPDGWQNLEKVFPDYASAVMKDTGS